MRTIYKYPIPIDDHFAIDMPRGAEVLTVQVQHGAPCVWAIVTPGAPMEPVCFRLAGTGHPLDGNPGRFVGTFQLHEGALVFHLFAKARP